MRPASITQSGRTCFPQSVQQAGNLCLGATAAKPVAEGFGFVSDRRRVLGGRQQAALRHFRQNGQIGGSKGLGPLAGDPRDAVLFADVLPA